MYNRTLVNTLGCAAHQKSPTNCTVFARTSLNTWVCWHLLNHQFKYIQLKMEPFVIHVSYLDQYDLIGTPRMGRQRTAFYDWSNQLQQLSHTILQLTKRWSGRMILPMFVLELTLGSYKSRSSFSNHGIVRLSHLRSAGLLNSTVRLSQ